MIVRRLAALLASPLPDPYAPRMRHQHVVSHGPFEPLPGGSRNVRFEVTGNYSGRLTASFVLGNGANTLEDIPSLPWTRDVAYAPDGDRHGDRRGRIRRHRRRDAPPARHRRRHPGVVDARHGADRRRHQRGVTASHVLTTRPARWPGTRRGARDVG